MLSELYIRDFAIIDELRLRFSAGFNVLTGETGAGKSIILDAMTLILGDRADTTMIRSGRSEAYVEATFELSERMCQDIMPLLIEEGLDDESENSITVARELRSTGRSISRVNGRTVSLGLLREISGPLVDIHGQGEHLSLFKPRSHLPLLDSYAGMSKQRSVVEREVSRLQEVQRELRQLRRDEGLLAQRVDMLRFQINEIDAAKLQPEEENDLREERVRLANAEQLMRFGSEALSLLAGEGDNSESAIDKLGRAERALAQLARYDATQSARLETLQGLSFQIDELAADLQRYLDELEFNPDRLDFVEERLELINSLKRKYGSDIIDILAWRDKAATELDQISRSEERTAELEQQEEALLRTIGKLGLQISLERKAAAERLASFVEHQLTELNMDGARFRVDFSYEPSVDGAYVEIEGETKRLAFDKSGIDRVEFLISTNPGEPLKPMVKVASGGETSRLMLALKTALVEVDATPTLIFDEIDQGIGGRVGDVAGRKLWGLTSSAQHQVIVVTHLPQLAGYGDNHFQVAKQMHGGRTTTAVNTLDEHGRIVELAAMLGTRGEHATGGAEAILRQASLVKRQTVATSGR